ncbi:MAG: phosphoribosylformylglycinamidine cyclo-ligase [Armatimonadetes bacterium]|nr:phosphoribosylformylglycinamidine cyclo-ligase [Armatimonadota bacterium]
MEKRKAMGLTYAGAGVDISAANRAVDLLRGIAKSTARPEVLSDIGSFSGLFALDARRYREPVLVAGTDGVGTKLKVAMLMDRHDTVGIDLVAMCANDIVTSGAEPLFFLDYLAVGRLVPEKVAAIVSGVAQGCRQAGCTLLGGETAEMPGFYGPEEYDLAGFVVGVAEKDRIIDGSRCEPGDCLVGLASAGLHSNGYSLARKAFFEAAGYRVDTYCPELGRTVGEEMLIPTRIYVKTVLGLLEKFDLKGIAHITGGGITENLPRILPEGTAARIERDSWPVPPVFGLIQKIGRVADDEMFRTFNLGLGMILAVSPGQVDACLARLAEMGERAYLVGQVVAGDRKVEYI